MCPLRAGLCATSQRLFSKKGLPLTKNREVRTAGSINSSQCAAPLPVGFSASALAQQSKRNGTEYFGELSDPVGIWFPPRLGQG